VAFFVAATLLYLLRLCFLGAEAEVDVSAVAGDASGALKDSAVNNSAAENTAGHGARTFIAVTYIVSTSWIAVNLNI
jgi:hypothetical protein